MPAVLQRDASALFISWTLSLVWPLIPDTPAPARGGTVLTPLALLLVCLVDSVAMGKSYHERLDLRRNYCRN